MNWDQYCQKHRFREHGRVHPLRIIGRCPFCEDEIKEDGFPKWYEEHMNGTVVIIGGGDSG